MRTKPDIRVSNYKFQNSELGTRNSELGIRNSEFGHRNSELGTQNSELGTRNSNYYILNHLEMVKPKPKLP
jgi:hypothetical protein